MKREDIQKLYSILQDIDGLRDGAQKQLSGPLGVRLGDLNRAGFKRLAEQQWEFLHYQKEDLSNVYKSLRSLVEKLVDEHLERLEHGQA